MNVLPDIGVGSTTVLNDIVIRTDITFRAAVELPTTVFTILEFKTNTVQPLKEHVASTGVMHVNPEAERSRCTHIESRILEEGVIVRPVKFQGTIEDTTGWLPEWIG
ncbi:hypothetical protein V6x_13190 [Gimesia chilikensis]|uniref:Uncharacterized protein n=1 Tax=Gimesia chilikensis TaxID=2605989 RepID=A0A517W8S3_9PLAN|nr:hypothetical protein V6x_13190 [Gimesia chilikensis]